MCVVKKRGRGGDGLPEFCVEVTRRSLITFLKSAVSSMQLPQVSGHFSLDCWVCGLAPLSNLLVVLALPKARDEDGRRQRPQLMVFDPEQQVPFLAG